MEELGIAPSHLYNLSNEGVLVGDKTYKEIEKLAKDTDWNVLVVTNEEL